MQVSNWCVITGAPSSGKTAVIEELDRRGYRIVPEVARALIDNELARGKSLERVKADIHDFERAILMEKIRIESALSEAARVFLDRALPDSIAYYVLEGLDPEEVRSECLRVRYRRVFLFERLRLRKDGVRSENDRLAQRLDRLLSEAYQELGYPVIRVPVMPIIERTDWVLARS